MNSFVAHSSPWRLGLLVLGAIIFVILGLWIAGIFGQPPKPGREWIGWLGVAFFGFCAVAGTPRIFDSGEQIKISNLGIYYKLWSEDTIPWTEITDVSIWEYKSQKSIILHLARPERFKSTTMLGKLGAANRALTGGDITLTLTGTDGRFVDAIATIDHFRKTA